MQKDVQALMRRWGNSLTLHKNGEKLSFRGFLHHSNSRSLQNLYQEFGPLGQIPGGWYVYIGPAEPAVQEGDILSMDGKQYRLRRVEAVTFREEPLYCWGLCVEKGGEDTWGQ